MIEQKSAKNDGSWQLSNFFKKNLKASAPKNNSLRLKRREFAVRGTKRRGWRSPFERKIRLERQGQVSHLGTLKRQLRSPSCSRSARRARLKRPW
jgi:hypothetical protein